MSRITAEYPPSLAHELAVIVSSYVTSGSQELPFDQWQQMLPPNVVRVEDGGGLPSTAFHMTRSTKDVLVALRSRWFRRLSDTKDWLKITAALVSGCRSHHCHRRNCNLMWMICWTSWAVRLGITCSIPPQDNPFDCVCGTAWLPSLVTRMRNFC